jgi:hypothetical protein
MWRDFPITLPAALILVALAVLILLISPGLRGRWIRTGPT